MAIRAPKLTFEAVQQLGDRAASQHHAHRAYLDAHPELTQIINDFNCALLEKKPEDAVKFAQEYFAGFKAPPTGIKLDFADAPPYISEAELRPLLEEAVGEAAEVGTISFVRERSHASSTPIGTSKGRGTIAMASLQSALKAIDTLHARHEFAIGLPPLSLEFAAGELERLQEEFLKKGPKPLVISGPEGVGVEVMVRQLIGDTDDEFGLCVRHTTRERREGVKGERDEVDGSDYHFVEPEHFRKLVSRGEFIEWTERDEHMYGTSKASINALRSDGRVPLLHVDAEAAARLRTSGIFCNSVFVVPPSLEELEKRVMQAEEDRAKAAAGGKKNKKKGGAAPVGINEEEMARRMEIARMEMEEGQRRGAYDHILMNIEPTDAYDKLKGHLSEVYAFIKPAGGAD